MSTEADTQSDVLAEAERINEERMEVMRKLAENVAHRRNLEQQVREAEKEEKRLATEAEKGGWTRRQVQRVIKPPKPRTAQSAASNGTDTEEAQPSDASVNTASTQPNP